MGALLSVQKLDVLQRPLEGDLQEMLEEFVALGLVLY
jgi:hypothetical protein